MKALLVLALSSVCLTAMADTSNTPVSNPQPAVEHYSYSSELDIAKVISMTEVPNVCEVVPAQMVYEDSHGMQHTLETKIARDGNQAALKLRGKLINAEKASAEELFGKANAKNDDAKGNREIKDLVAALGCGIQENYDENKLRFGRVIILTDADTDGSHIANLILAFFINYMPDLIKNGHVFRVDAPLFIAKANSQRAYGKTRAEIDNKMHKLGIKKYNVLRAKGWGEVSAEEMSELCLSPKTRKLIKIDYDKDINKSLSQTMGDDIQYRKEMMGIV